MVEPLNRYETDIVCTVEEGLALVEEVGHSHLGLLLDTFHANIEEATFDVALAAAAQAGRLWHVHIGDSNRLPPGCGHIDFAAIVRTLATPRNPGMKRTLAISLAMLLASPAYSAETLRYVALVDNGKQAGHQVVTTGDDGVTRVDFIFKDNGRGPELKEEFRLAPDGTYSSYRVTGTTTFGAPVDESFGRDGNKVWWKSTSDRVKLS